MKRQLVGVLALCLVALLGAAARAQQEFSSESKSWTFTMPAGWQVVSAKQLETLKKQYQLRNPDDPARIVVAFYKPGGPSVYPEVLVQVLDADMSRLSWPALQRMCDDGGDDSAGAATAALIADLIGTSGAEKYQFDANIGAVSATGSIVFDDQVEVTTACRAFLHSGGVVQLTALDHKSRAGGADRALAAFAGSFHFAQGRQFVAAADTKPAPRQRSTHSSGGYRYYGGGGGVVVVIAVIVRVLVRGWARGD